GESGGGGGATWRDWSSGWIQSGPGGQTLPPPPQLFWSLATSTHCPLHGMSPASEQKQCESKHSRPAPHACPQEPQFELSDVVSTHAAPQSVFPPGQTQALFSQKCPPLQTLPQAPQFKLSNVVSTHSPQSVV